MKLHEHSAASTGATAKHSQFRAALGLHHKAPINEQHDVAPHHQNLWPRIRLVLREPLSEFWGVFIMIMFGNGSVAQVLLSEGITTAPGGNGESPPYINRVPAAVLWAC